MSRFHGAQRPGARAAAKAVRRLAAEHRNTATPQERRAQFRRDRIRVRAALDQAAAERAAKTCEGAPQ